MKRIIALSLAVVILGLSFTPSSRAEEKRSTDVLVDKSRLVILEMTLSRDNKIPLDLIRQCAGLAIIPGMIKGGFFVGGSYGKGIVLARKNGTWTGPAFIRTAAGSFGIQFGVQSIDLILVVIGQNTMDSFLKTSFKLGADVGLAAGPIGAQFTAATEILLKGGIYSYSRSKGIFAGVSLEGAGIKVQPDLNSEYYKTTVNTMEILSGSVKTPDSGRELIAALNRIN